MPNFKKKPEELLADFRFVENLIKLSDEKDVKEELRSKSDVSDEKELDELSHEVFKVIGNLKKMDEIDLLKISGGVEEQKLASEAIEVARLGVNVKKDLATGNVPGAFTKLIKDNTKQGVRYLGSWFNYLAACNRYEASAENAVISTKITDDSNKSRKEFSDMKRNVALAALTMVGAAAVVKMFKKKPK